MPGGIRISWSVEENCRRAAPHCDELKNQRHGSSRDCRDSGQPPGIVNGHTNQVSPHMGGPYLETERNFPNLA